MSTDKPLSPEVVAATSTPENTGDTQNIHDNERLAAPVDPVAATAVSTGAENPSATVAQESAPDSTTDSTTDSTPESTPEAVSAPATEAAAEATAEAAPQTAVEAAPETLADGQPPLPPVPPVGATQSPAAEPENLPVQSESAPPANLCGNPL